MSSTTALPHNDTHHAGLLTVSEIWEVVRCGIWCPDWREDLETTSQLSADQVLMERVRDTTAFVLGRLGELQRMGMGPTMIKQVRLADIAKRNQADIGCHSAAELGCILAALRSLSSPWRKLPTELLVEIFAWCTSPTAVLNTSSAPLLLTRISSRWYNVSVKAPSLWPSLTLTENILTQEHADLSTVAKFEAKWRHQHINGLGSSAANFMSMMLHRSRTLPISLTTHSGIFLKPDTRRLFYEHAPRLEHLALFFPAYDNQSAPPVPATIDPFPAPHLQSLDIYALQVGPSIFGSRDTNWAAPFTELIRSCISTLRRVNVITYGAPLWPQMSLNHTWAKLTHITWKPAIFNIEVLKFFHSAPNLVSASFPSILAVSGIPEQLSRRGPAVLRSLETLIVGVNDMSTVFDAITAPNLKHFVHLAPSNEDKNALIEFFRRSSSNLETLYLYHATYRSHTDLLEVLESVEGTNLNSGFGGKQMKRKGHLKALLITDSHPDRILLSDKFLERLTWTPQNKATVGPWIDIGDSRISETEDCDSNDVLFPGVEYLSFYDIGSTTSGKLPLMLRSRTSDLPQKTCATKLKMFETWHGVTGLNAIPCGDWEKVEMLRNAGLVLRLFRSSDSAPYMTTAEKGLLGHYVEEGLVVRDYMHDIGQFAPVQLQTESRTYTSFS